MKLQGLSQKVFLDRYSLKDKKGKALEKTPDRMWRRVAAAVAGVETTSQNKKRWEKEFYSAMQDFKYVPGGRILAGAGTGFEVTYYNCFVIPSPKASREGILETLKQMEAIMRRGGGSAILDQLILQLLFTAIILTRRESLIFLYLRKSLGPLSDFKTMLLKWILIFLMGSKRPNMKEKEE